ncbi:MAG: type IV pilin-like G/H family protein [Phormidesmis sp.]
MSTQIKAKLLQHFSGKKKANGGFTLIELLVVIIIIGILSAIALPSFLNQASKAKQSEAKTYIGSVNRAQQAYYMENGTMAINDQFAQLGLGINKTTKNYKYRLIDATPAANGVRTFTAAVAKPIDQALKVYAGGVKTATIGEGVNQEATTLATLCEALLPAVVGGTDGTTGAETDITTWLKDVNATATTQPSCNLTKMKSL